MVTFMLALGLSRVDEWAVYFVAIYGVTVDVVRTRLSELPEPRPIPRKGTGKRRCVPRVWDNCAANYSYSKAINGQDLMRNSNEPEDIRRSN